MEIRIGHGYDVHRLTEGRKLILGGVEIPWEKGLLGHSDADVLLHAVTDALLGAAALGDIGRHFPDTDPDLEGIDSMILLKKTVEKYGEKIAVGVDVRDGFVAVKGWTENSALRFMDFCKEMEETGVKTLICTDISRDGAMRGTNREMYRELSETLGLQITASGGVSTLEDVESLRKMNLYGAIIGKAYYTGDINLKKAIETAR